MKERKKEDFRPQNLAGKPPLHNNVVRMGLLALPTPQTTIKQ